MSRLSSKNKVVISLCSIALVLIIALSMCLALYFHGASLSYDFDDFMARHNIDIPEGFGDHAKEFYEETIKQLEENPYTNFIPSWLPGGVYANRIQMAYLQDRHFIITGQVRSTYEVYEEAYAKQHQ